MYEKSCSMTGLEERCHAGLVSILMPMHNACNTVSATIRSILAQTYSNFELICVDDASTDGTEAIVQSFALSDDRIRWRSFENNQGVGAARNAALQLACGDYICFVDGDDTVEPTFVEVMQRRMVADGADVACCGWDRGLGSEVHSFQTEGVWRGDRALYALVADQTFFTSLWNKMFRRSSLVSDGGTLELFCETFQVGEDEEWLSRVLQHCDSCSVISDVLYHWNKTEGSLSFHQSLDTDEKAFSHLGARERTYRNLIPHREVAIKAQARLTASLVQFLATRYIEQGPVAKSRYGSVLQRACSAAMASGGGISKMKSRILILLMWLGAPCFLVRLVRNL